MSSHDRQERLIDDAWRQVADLRQAEESQPVGRRIPNPETGADAACPPVGSSAWEMFAAESLPGYEILGEIQRGGQGVVYQARQNSTGRSVAIKVLKEGPFSGPADRLRFDREIHILGQLQHPNIVTIHDSGSSTGCFFFVMDYIAGQTLEEYIAAGKRPIEETLRMFVKICDAVSAAHLRGIVHRDLKPGNIRIDLHGEPRILDFGLAKIADASPESTGMTVTGQFVGSLPWSSPEQAEGLHARVDLRTDVYALGVILFQMLTGRLPYESTGNVRGMMESILHAPPIRPGAIDKKIDDELDTIVLKCLAKEPERRYQNAGEIARDVRRYQAGEAIEAKRDSSWYLLRKAIRRHRFRAALAGLALLILVQSVIALAFVAHRESVLRDEAERHARIARAVNAFLNEDLLSAVRPGARGREVTVREVLDAASERIERQFPDEPLVEAAVRDTLGNAYMELGEWMIALPHARQALALREAHLGRDHVDTLSTMMLVGRLHRRLDRHAEAEAALQQMVTIAQSRLGAEHALVTQGMNNLSYVLEQLGRKEEALAMNSRALEIRTRNLGPKHIETLRSLHNQGYYLEQFDRIDEAEQHYALAYRLREESLGLDHPDTLSSMSNLANLWVRHGRLEDGERMHLDQLERSQRVHGPRHPTVLQSFAVLSDIYRRQQRYDEAESTLERALQGWRELVGEDHQNVAHQLRRMGQLYADQGRFKEAEDAYIRALDVFRKTLGENHEATNSMVATLELFRTSSRTANDEESKD